MLRQVNCVTVLGLVSWLILGCTSETPNTAGAAVGGTTAASSSPSNGGSSATSSSSKGGTSSSSSKQGSSSDGGSSQEEGGSSDGGSSDSEIGGSSTKGGSSSSKGGSSAKGGSSNTGGSSAKGGSSNTNGGSSAKGGANTGATTGGSSAKGGSSPTSSTTNPGSCTPSTEKFSFFVTSQKRLFALAKAFNGSENGFGGDLRYGETGDDAGLKGADKICKEIAEQAAPGNCKTWRAFLSTSKVNAIDRIGSGPWYDAFENLFGNNPQEILATRPPNAHESIKNDFPNEDGIPNHDALQTGNTQNQDNHDFLTGSGSDGKLYKGSTDTNCRDWTSLDKSIRPRVGHSWPRPMGGAMGGGAMGGGMGDMDMNHWISSLDENGCAAGANLSESSIPTGNGDGTVGGGGGYGGLYCFASEE